MGLWFIFISSGACTLSSVTESGGKSVRIRNKDNNCREVKHFEVGFLC